MKRVAMMVCTALLGSALIFSAPANSYGSNKNKKNALGKCVSQKVKEGEGPTGEV